MSALLKFALGVDWVSDRFSKIATWSVLLSAGFCAANAFVRYGLTGLSTVLNRQGINVLDGPLSWYGTHANALLEIQWYLFGWMVMVGAPYVLKVNEHVRVDLVYGKLKGNGPVYIDIFGLLFFLLPVIGVLTWLSWPFFLNQFNSGEMSQNSGGLIRWPVGLALPLGFGLMLLQGLAELIKRFAYLNGSYQMDTHYEKPLQ